MLETPNEAVSFGYDDPNSRTSSLRRTIFPFTNTAPPVRVSARYNFISFLAVSQRLRVPLLPITWDRTKRLVGSGYSGRITENSMSLTSSFAFKRIGTEDKLDNVEEIYSSLIHELSILRHDHIEGHPNIPELEGVCWDIIPIKPDTAARATGTTPPFRLWPVLVLQKSEYGDLYQFLLSSRGQGMSMSDRLKLCVDIGNAVATLQDHHIIHGDIKPQNVLVFDAEDSVSVITKLIDFSFSSWCDDATGLVTLAGSWPWYAPECNDQPKFTPSEARKTDVYSFGMLCLWFLFDKFFSSLLTQPDECQAWKPYLLVVNGATSVLEILGTLKTHRLLPQLAKELVAEEANISDESKMLLQQFFSGSLADDPTSRYADIRAALSHLVVEEAHRARAPTGNYLAYNDRLRRQICKSLHFLYNSDYRLRVYVISNLQDIVDKNPGLIPLPHDAAIDSKIQEKLEYITNSDNDVFEVEEGTFFGLHDNLGFIKRQFNVDVYRQEAILPAAEEAMRLELSHVKDNLGPDHWITLQLMTDLASILNARDKGDEAGELDTEILRRRTLTLGRQHTDTLNAMSTLVARYMADGKLDLAEKLATEVAETSVNRFTKDDPVAMTRMSDLGWIYARRGKLQEAADIFRELIALEDREPGHEFYSTLANMESLALVYAAQHKFQDAEHILLRVISSRDLSWGRDDPETLKLREYLASLYRQQGREAEATALLGGKMVDI
ncbi:hypothetical protein ONZ43_g7252 [Nemania bipapillata]|uniref:Uncharacterized protein n=1 Tax=Nemania bipapillata TaxID=110536 RepID=A0ACC2HTL3_9PEZI|nr:hypothetical protein ONZ43_g7252 [Nemania bipapillata]